MEEYRERLFTYVLLQSPTKSLATHLESYLLDRHYTSKLDNLYDNIEVDPLEGQPLYRELKLAIGDELQTLFHPIVNATKQAAEETRKELEPMKKTLAGIDGALKPVAEAIGPRVDNTFGIYSRKDGQMQMGIKLVKISEDETNLKVEDADYELAPGLHTLIMQKHPRPNQWTYSNYQVCKSLSAQTKVRSHPNSAGAARPHATWKYKHMVRKMVVPGEKIVEEESEENEDTDTASTGSVTSSPSSHKARSRSPSPPDVPEPSPLHTRSYGKARTAKDRGPFYKGFKGEGVVYLPGDINGLARKLQLLAAEFFAGSTTARNALLRLKELTRKEYTNITARLTASL